MADFGEYQTQEVEYFSCGGNGGPGIAYVDLLFYGYGWRDAVYVIYIGFIHSAEELPGI